MASAPFQNPRGTRDQLPEDLLLIHHLERVAHEVAGAAGYEEVRTPFFEETRLFMRSLGDTSDVVEKEMFTVPRRQPEGAPSLPPAEALASSYTFRPEGTASCARAYVQAGCAANAPAQKWYYLGPMFRYERPQKGRERQFTQFGIEAFGSSSPLLDAEVIGVALRFFQRLGFGPQLEVRVNTMGDPADREAWAAALREFFAPQFGANSERCADCQARFERNIFRLLDCKSPRCVELNQGAPDLFTVLGKEAGEHHQRLCAALGALEATVTEDRSIVRGLDYYSRTVFEIHYPPLGARSALCGGGRYDGLVEEVGGRPTPAMGFSIGFTPTELALAELNLPAAADLEDLRQARKPQIYVVAMTEEDRLPAMQVAEHMRLQGWRTLCDMRERSGKAQLKEAAKLEAPIALILGPDERATGSIKVRDMQAKEEQDLAQSALVEHLQRFFAGA